MKFLFINGCVKSNIVGTLFVLVICYGYLPQLFAVGICHSFCRCVLPWEFAVAICCGNLPQLFAVAICCGFCFVYVSKPYFCVSKSFFFISKSFLIESKPLLYVSKTFSIYENFFINSVSFRYCGGS